MRDLKRVSRWITIQTLDVTEKHSLFYYAEKDEACNGKYTLLAFRYRNRWYALNQFLSRYGIMGFDKDCEEYPQFICGYDGENYWNPLYCELDEYGDKIRLYKTV